VIAPLFEFVRVPATRRLPEIAKPRQPCSVDKLIEQVSASRLACWQQCRLKFHFRYVLGLVKPPTPALHVGKVVHAVLQQWNLARWRSEKIGRSELNEFFQTDWEVRAAENSTTWDEDEEAERSIAWLLLETYWRETPIRAGERPEAVEVAVEAELPGLPKLIGVIDLVRAGGRIVDFKTSSKTPDASQAAHLHELQTSCYALLYRDATGKREEGIELHHLVKTAEPKLCVTRLPPMTASQEQRLRRSIESYVQGVRRRDFVPSPGFHCGHCEYFRECRNWNGTKS
jgi:putative RecB family exonuclease